MLRRLTVSLLLLPIALVGAATTSEATGFRIAAHGAKAMGMDGAFAAQADDPSAIYYNPAGLTQLEGTQFLFGGTAIVANGSTYEPFAGTNTLPAGSPIGTPPVAATGADVPSHTFFLPAVFVTHKFGDRFAAGFGTYVPFGLELDWPDTWTGRQITTFDSIKAYYFDFAAAYQITPWWSIAAGFDVVRSSVKLSRTGFTGPTESMFQFEGDGTGYTYEVGTLLKPSDRISLGINYRHKAVIDYDGGLHIDPPAGPFAFSDASTSLPLPATLVVGIAVKPTDRWTVEFDWDFTFWESFRDLALSVPDAPPIETNLRASAPFPNRGWNNSSIFRLGTEYKVTDPLALRVGFAYIQTPVPDHSIDPILPDSDRTTFSGGFGYAFTKSFSFDLAYEYQRFHERAKNNGVLVDTTGAYAIYPGLRANGIYRTDAHAITTQLKFAF